MTVWENVKMREGEKEREEERETKREREREHIRPILRCTLEIGRASCRERV